MKNNIDDDFLNDDNKNHIDDFATWWLKILILIPAQSNWGRGWS